ncbi:MAG: type II toxin-antitoxin system RelE/ParE family toxin [Deltaproteobacteria bacterium]|nr:type II toxin-antitoxin system RelE/ParE family toxin [Deltaproteobacteria bacterium]
MKAFQVVWSEKAASDLRQIKNFISYDKPQAARSLIEKIKSRAERLTRFPQSGRIVPELSRNEIREIVVGNYRVIYKLSGRRVLILTVFEAHRTPLF